MSVEEVQKGLGSARFLQAYSVGERAFASRAIIEACRRAGIIVSLSDQGARDMLRALVAWYWKAARDERRAARSLIAKTLQGAVRKTKDD